MKRKKKKGILKESQSKRKCKKKQEREKAWMNKRQKICKKAKRTKE